MSASLSGFGSKKKTYVVEIDVEIVLAGPLVGDECALVNTSAIPWSCPTAVLGAVIWLSAAWTEGAEGSSWWS